MTNRSGQDAASQQQTEWPDPFRLHPFRSRPSPNFAAQQRRFDRWRNEYNHCLPHETLGMQKPVQWYKRSPRKINENVMKAKYPNNYDIHKISTSGFLASGRNNYLVGEVFAGRRVGLLTNSAGKLNSTTPTFTSEIFTRYNSDEGIESVPIGEIRGKNPWLKLITCHSSLITWLRRSRCRISVANHPEFDVLSRLGSKDGTSGSLRAALEFKTPCDRGSRRLLSIDRDRIRNQPKALATFLGPAEIGNKNGHGSVD